MHCGRSVYKQGQGQWPFGLSESLEPTTFSAIYNSLRYDDVARIVTFHLREKDWNKLKSNSWMWISCSDMNPVINREPVHVGDETVESVVRIDPLEKFGLSSVQTFIVTESSTNSEVLKALKVEENTLSYFAELEILDSVNCKAKAMKITFQPAKCPTEVHIGFEGAKG
ncbi:hypothetical protein OS493_022187 [Desmophyllum pertusum]|uniref:Uncharacterized protein n=1 Tax=Desmophyllum pertusum TaxID=174260 RepID=A0A9W9YAN0_9CNID|nr:hypothetical protein OS493_022187 [Desmophyllum pertusum]